MQFLEIATVLCSRRLGSREKNLKFMDKNLLVRKTLNILFTYESEAKRKMLRVLERKIEKNIDTSIVFGIPDKKVWFVVKFQSRSVQKERMLEQQPFLLSINILRYP
jgi:hypothetical protein